MFSHADGPVYNLLSEFVEQSEKNRIWNCRKCSEFFRRVFRVQFVDNDASLLFCICTRNSALRQTYFCVWVFFGECRKIGWIKQKEFAVTLTFIVQKFWMLYTSISWFNCFLCFDLLCLVLIFCLPGTSANIIEQVSQCDKKLVRGLRNRSRSEAQLKAILHTFDYFLVRQFSKHFYRQN